VTRSITIPDDLAELVHDRPEIPGYRVEIVDGVLEVSRHVPGIWRQLMAKFFVAYFDGRGYFAVENLDVAVTAAYGPTADVVVFASRDVAISFGPGAVPLAQVRAIVEIVSRGHERADRELKMKAYFEAGLDEYWTVERSGPDSMTGVARRFVRGEDGYRLAGTIFAE
jgi:hypothetical protein